MTSENTLKIAPLALNSEKKFQCFSNLSNIVLPEINFIIELLVVWGALHVAEHDDVIFDDLVDVFCAHNLVVVLIVSLAFQLLDFKVGDRIILPDTSDFFKLDFNLELFSGIIC